MQKQRVISRSVWKVLLIVLVFSLSGLSEGCAMGAFDHLVLFSEVHGKVLKDGKPVEGAELIQTVVWSDNKDEIPPQRAITDAQGAFSFPVVERKAGLLRIVPHQPVMLQKIIIHYQGAEYTAWRHTKDRYDLHSEMDGKPINLVCELTREPDFEGTHYGICKAI